MEELFSNTDDSEFDFFSAPNSEQYDELVNSDTTEETFVETTETVEVNNNTETTVVSETIVVRETTTTDLGVKELPSDLFGWSGSDSFDLDNLGISENVNTTNNTDFQPLFNTPTQPPTPFYSPFDIPSNTNTVPSYSESWDFQSKSNEEVHKVVPPSLPSNDFFDEFMVNPSTNTPSYFDEFDLLATENNLNSNVQPTEESSENNLKRKPEPFFPIKSNENDNHYAPQPVFGDFSFTYSPVDAQTPQPQPKEFIHRTFDNKVTEDFEREMLTRRRPIARFGFGGQLYFATNLQISHVSLKNIMQKSNTLRQLTTVTLL